jgi:hypothetical protein
MIPEDRRKALARTRAAQDTGRALVEQTLVLMAGAAALLLFLVA